ncbi:hypothetical protein HPB50_005060 [Hyalomma asiaticum]|uniref:Uncharacterized protein n=1 Tax=Hyalomma asiaticum TaxID=266040 RepID=A0ACB7SKA7_HYAAI|nr:hypothetical protein HPB50_005060 [Hyalomma asiaticum]
MSQERQPDDTSVFYKTGGPLEVAAIPGPTMPERPLLCVYWCVEVGKRHARFPHDGLCDFLFYHLDGNRVPFAMWEKSRCAAKIVATASASKRTLMGVSIDGERGKETREKLSEDEGVRAAVQLWKHNVKHHGVNYVVGDPSEVRAAADKHLEVFEAFHDIQLILHAFHGTDASEKSYTLLGLQPRDAGTKTDEWATLIQSLVTTHNIDLLVLNTHVTKWAPDCVVSGPAILRNTLTQPLPDIDTAVRLINKTSLPDTVVVIFSLSVAVVKFAISPTLPEPSGYGAVCKSATIEEYRMACWDEMKSATLVDEAQVMIGKLGPHGQPCLWESKETVTHKVKSVFDRYKRARFGWAIDRIEKADLYDTCRDTALPGGYPLTRTVRKLIRDQPATTH